MTYETHKQRAARIERMMALEKALESHKIALTQWYQNQISRDWLIWDAYNAQMSISEIHRLTRVSRTTIYRILSQKGSEIQLAKHRAAIAAR